jgi:hypothetical protein
MAMQASPEMIRDRPAGQRLCCAKCGSEIEIIQPCTCNPPDQSFRCCGQEMKPSVGNDVHLSVE